jgi:putrescine transport system substrate-binding protein
MRATLRIAAALVAGTAAASALAQDKVVHVYNWNDYVAPEVIAAFEKETGIKVVYDVYDDNSVLEAKLLAGKSGYDLVFPSTTPYFANHIKAGLYRKLDKSQLPNLAGLDREVMAYVGQYDPGNAHGVPYLMAGTGIGYNVKKVKELLPAAPVGSWAMIFDPKALAKLKGCGVSWLDAHEELIPAALAYLGRDPLSQDKGDMDAAIGVLMQARPYLRYIHSSSYINDLANGDTCVAHGYAGDLVQARDRAREAGKGVEIGIFLPREGAPYNIDVMAIPADAPHPEAAHTLINHLLKPENMAAITNAVGYANAVPASNRGIKPEVLADPVIYPPPEVRANLFTTAPMPRDAERTRTRAWTKVKSRY